MIRLCDTERDKASSPKLKGKIRFERWDRVVEEEGRDEGRRMLIIPDQKEAQDHRKE